jgi:hypothetical protein
MNVYEQEAREKKAARLAEVILGAGITREEWLRWTDAAWRLAVQEARVLPPSAATRQRVAELLEERWRQSGSDGFSA